MRTENFMQRRLPKCKFRTPTVSPEERPDKTALCVPPSDHCGGMTPDDENGTCLDGARL